MFLEFVLRSQDTMPPALCKLTYVRTAMNHMLAKSHGSDPHQLITSHIVHKCDFSDEYYLKYYDEMICRLYFLIILHPLTFSYVHCGILMLRLLTVFSTHITIPKRAF